MRETVAFSPDSGVVAIENYFKSHEGSVALIEVAIGPRAGADRRS